MATPSKRKACHLCIAPPRYANFADAKKRVRPAHEEAMYRDADWRHIASTFHTSIMRDGTLGSRDNLLFGKAWPQFATRLAAEFQHLANQVGSSGNFEIARGLHESALLVTADNPTVLNLAAWFLATCSSDSVRDGNKAVRLARKACELSDWKEWALVDTYAAALAETGDFTAAIGHAERAAELANNLDEKKQVEKALAGYRVGQPMRLLVVPTEN